jgi:hypothetical protein
VADGDKKTTSQNAESGMATMQLKEIKELLMAQADRTASTSKAPKGNEFALTESGGALEECHDKAYATIGQHQRYLRAPSPEDTDVGDNTKLLASATLGAALAYYWRPTMGFVLAIILCAFYSQGSGSESVGHDTTRTHGSNDVDPLETPYTGSTLDLIHGQVHPFHGIE